METHGWCSLHIVGTEEVGMVARIHTKGGGGGGGGDDIQGILDGKGVLSPGF